MACHPAVRQSSSSEPWHNNPLWLSHKWKAWPKRPWLGTKTPQVFLLALAPLPHSRSPFYFRVAWAFDAKGGSAGKENVPLILTSKSKGGILRDVESFWIQVCWGPAFETKQTNPDKGNKVRTDSRKTRSCHRNHCNSDE